MSRKKIHISDINLNEIGGRFAFIRIKRGATHKEFADLLGISASNLSEIENHKHNPSFIPITRIIDQFNIDPMWLLFGENDPYNKDKRGVCEPCSNYSDPYKDLIDMTRDVLSSQTEYANSLAANIRSFHKSVSLEQSAENNKGDPADRTRRLEEKCDHIIDEIDQLTKRMDKINHQGEESQNTERKVI
jgi:transcriptional regulator with XRE-family HTH domain